MKIIKIVDLAFCFVEREPTKKKVDLHIIKKKFYDRNMSIS